MKTTLIGSIPTLNPTEAVELIFRYVSVPCWPQLPKRSFKEHMCPQYSENFPGIQIDENEQKIWLEEEKFYLEVESFYQNYLDKNFDFFKISKDYSLGFYEFVETIKFEKPKEIKLQTTGPITFGLTVKTKQGQAIFYNEQFREPIEKHLVLKSLWQIKTILESLKEKTSIILFYDEPYLAAYGSAFTSISKEEIIASLEKTISETKQLVQEVFLNKIELRIGIHCCANTDWSLLTSLKELDIISFDTYEFFESFLVYSNEIKDFVAQNKKIAWGIIPNSDKILNESFDSLANKLSLVFEKLINKGVNLNKNNVENEIITPQCGLGGVNLQVLEKILQICSYFNNIKKL